MEVDGASLVLGFDHQSGDFHYPILVDPSFTTEDYGWGAGAACPGQNLANPGVTYWHWETADDNKWNAGCNSTEGILDASVVNQYFPANSYA